MSKAGTKRYVVPPSLRPVVGPKAGKPLPVPGKHAKAAPAAPEVRTALAGKAKGPTLNDVAKAADYNNDGRVNAADTKIARELTKIELANVKTTDAKAVVASGMADIAAFNAQAKIWTAQGTAADPAIVQGDVALNPGGGYVPAPPPSSAAPEDIDPFTGKPKPKALPVAALAMPVAVVVVALIALFGRKRAQSRGGEA